jgi:hypothetical protein
MPPTVVVVAGSGRSGTSLFSGILQRLGFRVPGPEVPADETNPRGFAESQWVVDFHARLLERVGVQVSDARPAAWAETGRLCLDSGVQRELRGWLAAQLASGDQLVVKDPRLSWFLPLWRRCAEEAGAAPRVVTVLRHPAAVIDSKQRWYGGPDGEARRAAGWLNQTLFTERATRELRRAFVRYDELVEDWTRTVARVGDALELDVIRNASAVAIRDVHEFVDRDLRRSSSDWGLVPEALRAQAEEVWGLVSRLGEDPAPGGELGAGLDAARGAYAELYGEAEAIADSSIVAAGRARARVGGAPGLRGRRLIRRIPVRYKRMVPAAWRARIVSALAGR